MTGSNSLKLESTTPPESSERLVLVVEDDSSLRELLCRSLTRAKYRTIQACDGEEAYARFQQGGLDVIVTDFLMPKMNGGQLIRKIKEGFPAFPMVLVTGEAPDQIILELAKMQGLVALMKPFQPEALFQALDYVLKKPLADGHLNFRSCSRVDTMIQCVIEGRGKAIIRNLSFGGCFIESSEDFKPGASLEFRLMGLDKFVIPGVVAWARGDGFGVRFSTASEEVETFLKKFVLNKLKQQGVGIMGAGNLSENPT